MVYLVFHRKFPSHTFADHRIRWCFQPVGAGGAEAVTCCSSTAWHQWHKGDEFDMGEPRWWMPPKRTQKLKEAWGASDVDPFSVNGPSGVSTKPSLFYCRICRKDVSLLIHGHHEFLSHFQGSEHFLRDQRWRSERPSWEMLGYEGNAMSPVEVERQPRGYWGFLWSWETGSSLFLETSLSTRLLLWTPTILGFMAKVCSLIEVLRLGGSYELAYQL